jgi:hypothetical protein
MTNITFKNGGPIFLAEDGAPGLVAASQNCCCPPPPPPGCWCPDWCLYQVQILSPVSFPPLPTSACFFPGTDESIYLRREVIEGGLYEPCEDEDQCCGPVMLPPYTQNNYAQAYVFLPGYASFRYSSRLSAVAEASISFRCENANEPGVTYADIQLFISVPGADGLVQQTPNRVLRKNATVQLDSTCSLRTGVICSDPNAEARFAFLDVPLEFTVNNESAGLVEWDESRTVDVPIGDQTRVTPCFDHLVDNFEVTFRITARENCLPPENVCCCEENTVTVSTAEECDGTTSPVADPIVDLEDITIVVDWDGLTLTLEHPSFSGNASEAVEFSCLKDNEEEAFNATERNFSAGFTPQNDTFGQCRWFSSVIVAFFIGKFPSTNFDALAQSSGLSPYVGECKLLAPVDEDDTSCTFIPSAGWCMDNPFSDTVTVEMIIAP